MERGIPNASFSMSFGIKNENEVQRLHLLLVKKEYREKKRARAGINLWLLQSAAQALRHEKRSYVHCSR